MPVTLITGASRGLGLALARCLAERGHDLVVDARDGAALERALVPLAGWARVVRIPGDVADPAHRRVLADAVADLGRLDVLVNNASVLGPSPQPALADYPLDELARVLAVNAIAPLALVQLTLPWLTRTGGRIVNLTSDASATPYPGWGGYGSAKAALDQLSAVLGVEHPALRVYAFDPGDMRTDLHQLAFPGEDISDRPEPETVVPALLRLLDEELPSGRYEVSRLLLTGASA